MACTNKNATVALECWRVMEIFPQVTHHDRCLRIFMELSEFLQKNIFGAGELVSKHLITIMSVLGVLPASMSTNSFVQRHIEELSEVGETVRNWQFTN
jgi:hypothetical protein